MSNDIRKNFNNNSANLFTRWIRFKNHVFTEKLEQQYDGALSKTFEKYFGSSHEIGIPLSTCVLSTSTKS